MLFAADGNQVDISLGCPPDAHWEDFFIRNHADIGCPQLSHGDAAAHEGRPILYGVYIDRRPEQLQCLYDFLTAYPGFTLDFYQDMYDRVTWCLELCSCDASKGHAVQRLREVTDFGQLTAFGDGEMIFRCFMPATGESQ